MMRETVVAPLGLVTRPNEVGQYPAGALKSAINVCMRSPGIVEPLPARLQYAANGGGANVVHRIFPLTSSLLVQTASSGLFTVTDASRNTVALPSGWSLSSASRFSSQRGLSILTTTGDPIVVTGPTTSRPVGLPVPTVINVSSFATSSAAQAIADGRNVNYRAIVTRSAGAGKLSSAPTNILNVRNTSGAVATPDVRVRWPSVASYAVGDVVEFYRTPSQANGTDPGTRFLLCGTVTLAAGDIAARQATLTDNCADADLGMALYSNPGQPRENAKHNRTPGQCTDVAAYNGYTFYAAPYSHVRGVFKVRGRVGNTGATATSRTHGIGTREQQGDFTNGSPTVLNLTITEGLVAGQVLEPNARIPAGTTILSVVGTTMTMSQNATATAGASVFQAYDTITIQGVTYTFASLEGLATAFYDADYPLMMRINEYVKQTLDASGVPVSNVSGVNAVTILFEDLFYTSFGVGGFSYAATNGQNYSPVISASYAYPFNSVPGRLMSSKFEQPEHVPGENETLVGSGNVHRIIATKDALFAFTSAGLFRVTGSGFPFTTRLIDETLRLATSSCVGAMLDKLWAYTNRGLVVIGPMGVEREVSQAVVGDLIPGSSIVDATVEADQLNTFLTCDERNREVRLCIRSSGTSTIYLYNALTDRFSTIVDTGAGSEVAAECVAPFLGSALVWSPTVAGATTPLYRYATDGTTRTDETIRFQPIYGTKEPFTLKQWSDFEFLFRNVGLSTFTINATVNGATAYSGVAGTARQDGTRAYVTGMTLADAMAPSASFGFDSATDGGSGWQLVGMSARWVPLSQQVQK
jgi:hypothetical protein